MTRKFKRGYIEKGWFNTMIGRLVKDEYAIQVSKVTQNDDFGKWQDEDEDEIKSIGGFKTIEEAEECLKKEFKVKEIIRN